MKSTPGPWHTTSSNDGSMIVAGNVVIAKWPDYGGTPEQVANAVLIASAPSLLHALSMMVEHFATPTTKRNPGSYAWTNNQVAQYARNILEDLKGSKQ